MGMPGDNCERHEREINRLREQVEELNGELARRETIVTGVQHDIHALSERVPADLGHWMGRTSVTLENLARGQNDVVTALREGYVTVAELEVVRNEQKGLAKKADLDNLRTELEPIKGAFWKAAGLVALTLLGAALAIIFEWKKAIPPTH